VWVFDKGTREGKKRAPKNIFREPHLYSFPAGAPNRYDLETKLSQLEGKFRRIRDERLAKHKPLSTTDFVSFMAFVAAMHSRTPRMRDHHQEQWRHALDMMEDLDAAMKRATPAEREAQARMPRLPGSTSGPSLNIAQVRSMVAYPMLSMFYPFFAAELKGYCKMQMTVLCTTPASPFITSDAPVAWFDPRVQGRQGIYAAVGLRNATVEVTMPLSPRQLLLLTWRAPGPEMYVDIQDGVVQELNRRALAFSDKQFVSCNSSTHDRWFDPNADPPWAAKQADSHQHAHPKCRLRRP
jgi:hypothetical protein